MSRYEVSNVRVPTAFGTVYVHIHHIEDAIKNVTISSPGKMENSTVQHILDSITRPGQLKHLMGYNDPSIAKMFTDITMAITQEIATIKKERRQ